MVIPQERAIHIAVGSQVLNGIVLPFVLVFMLLLINKKDLMGEFVNTRLFNLIAWATTIVMIILTVAYLFAP